MNLEEKLNNSLNDILKSSGYIFEIISSGKKQSNIIAGTNNQLITPSITNQLNSSINKFNDLLDDTISKFNDAKWCIESILETKQKEELKLKMEEEKQRRIKEEEEKKRISEEAARKRKEEEEKARIQREKEAKEKEEEARRQKELEEKRKAEEEKQKQQQQQQQQQQQKQQEQQKQQQQQQQQQRAKEQNNPDDLPNFISPSFDFNFNDAPPDAGDHALDIPNPSDILSSINYDGFDANPIKNTDSNGNNGIDGTTDSKGDDATNRTNDAMDLDMNNILENDELILDGLNISLLDQGFDNQNGGSGNVNMEEEFDVDNFLNQFGGAD